MLSRLHTHNSQPVGIIAVYLRSLRIRASSQLVQGPQPSTANSQQHNMQSSVHGVAWSPLAENSSHQPQPGPRLRPIDQSTTFLEADQNGRKNFIRSSIWRSIAVITPPQKDSPRLLCCAQLARSPRNSLLLLSVVTVLFPLLPFYIYTFANEAFMQICSERVAFLNTLALCSL